MLAEVLAKLDVVEHSTDVPYMLQCEVAYLISVVEDVDARMKALGRY